jgi:hypothetical protein
MGGGMQLPPASYIHKHDGNGPMPGNMMMNGSGTPPGMVVGHGGGMMPPGGPHNNGMGPPPPSFAANGGSPNSQHQGGMVGNISGVAGNGPGGPGPVKQCAGCGMKIADRFLLHSMDRYWHHACLKCSCCQATLVDIGSSCYSRNGFILCKNDYIR